MAMSMFSCWDVHRWGRDDQCSKRRKPWSKSRSATTSGAYKIHQNIIKTLRKGQRKSCKFLNTNTNTKLLSPTTIAQAIDNLCAIDLRHSLTLPLDLTLAIAGSGILNWPWPWPWHTFTNANLNDATRRRFAGIKPRAILSLVILVLKLRPQLRPHNLHISLMQGSGDLQFVKRVLSRRRSCTMRDDKTVHVPESSAMLLYVAHKLQGVPTVLWQVALMNATGWHFNFQLQQIAYNVYAYRPEPGTDPPAGENGRVYVLNYEQERDSERERERGGVLLMTALQNRDRLREREEACAVRLPWLLSKSTQSEINSSNSKITIDFQRSRSVVSQESRRIHK